MMNYNEFMEYAAGHIKDLLPAGYQSAEIRLETVQKTSEQYTGLMVRPEGRDSAPVANMKMFYEQYQATDSIDRVMADIASVLQMEPPSEIDVNVLKDYDQVKDKLFVRLSPVEGNETIMAESPHTMQADMLMTYHIYIPSKDDGFLSARVTNQMMEDYTVTPEQLHQDAIANTPRIFEPKVQSMMEALTGIPEEDPQMMVVTNSQGSLGASALFCEGIMDKAAEHMKGNYFVLPSSIHEMLVVPDNGNFNRADLESMVKQANQTVVEPADKLSDTVYHYDHQDRVFERADTYEKRVQTKAAEKGSLLGKLQDKKEQVERTAPGIGQNRQRQTGLAM